MKKKLIVVGILLAAVTVLGYYICSAIDIQWLIAQREVFTEYIEKHKVLSVVLFFLFYAGVVISTFPLAAIFTILAGFLFGVVGGTLLTLFAGTAGAIVSFLMFRYSLGKSIQRHYRDKLENFNKNMKKYGARYLIMIHFLMVVPFFVINMLAAVTTVSLLTFIWTTFVGLIPSTILYTYAGSQLSTINSPKDIITWPVILLIVGVVVLLGGTILKDKFTKKS